MLRQFLTAFFCLFTAFSVPIGASAQDQSRAILVLDASGSMWGQIEGVAKITIAQEVIGDLLTTLPENQLLGLTAYGHRRKGDCSDIETLHLPGTDRATIANTVNAIKPKGKTPLSAAVIQAAEALKYTEEVATVILVSDGIETCNLDPCEVGRMLEETGVSFTAHVIGFDVTDPATQAQLQCLAEETGGTYLSADNADELSEALQEVAEATPEPEPVPVTVTFRATEGKNGPVINSDLVWNMATDEGGIFYEYEAASQISHDLLPGGGQVSVLRTTDETSAEATFTVGTSDMVVTLVLPEFIPPATLEAPASAPAGSLVAVTWTGPDGVNDYIASSDVDMGDGYYHHYTYTRDGEDNIVMLRLPPEAGNYEIRYVMSSTNKVLARRVIEVTPLDIGFDAPAEAVAGSTIQVGWIGPDYKNDYLSIASLDQGDNYYVNYEYTREGNPTPLVMPAEPGSYEIRYVLGASRHVAGRTNIEVVEVLASLEAADTAPAGSDLAINWQGPDYKNDHITIAEIGSRGNQYLSYEYTRDGSPASLTLPLTPGDYELRYVVSQDHTILARRAISVSAVTAMLDAPASAASSSKAMISWSGPDYKNDHITIAEIGAKPNQYESYTYTRDGSPLSLQMPTEPGEYEIRYIAGGSPRTILARAPIVIEAVSGSIEAPDSAPANSVLVINWSGPDEKNDHITVAKPGAKPNQYESYTYTREGSPLNLQMPTSPGEYELRYIVQGTDRDILVRRPITVTSVSAMLDVPDQAPAGSQLVVTWSGPDGRNDHITVAEPGAKPNQYESYTYTRDGSPLRLQMPSQPGEYELRYIVQGTDRDILVRRPITIMPVPATLEAPASAPAGSLLLVSWLGPDYKHDHISIAEPGAKPNKYESFTYTRDGTPLRIKVPTQPGTYELRYILQGTERMVLVQQPLIVEPVEATLQAEATVAAGGNLVVNWSGPDYHNDYIAISQVGEKGYETYTYTKEGSPLIVKAPDQPGSYEVRYVISQDRTIIASQTLTVQ
ncbi:MAG: VWA domain-containing protein [Rhodobacteraceae bacterium]|nr:VWA domain-containing protein [Paracoccaceae bacterium]